MVISDILKTTRTDAPESSTWTIKDLNCGQSGLLDGSGSYCCAMLCLGCNMCSRLLLNRIDLANAARRSDEDEEDVVSSSNDFGNEGGFDLGSQTCSIPCNVRSGHTARFASFVGLPFSSTNPTLLKIFARLETHNELSVSLQGRLPSQISAPLYR